MAYTVQEKEQDAMLDRLLRGHQPETNTSISSSIVAATSTSLSKHKRTKWAKKQEIYLANTAHGFEDFFADVPLRPEEYVDEREQYSKQKSPAMRMELCIQKYRVSRRLVNQGWRERVFNAYLVHGGIDTGQKDYGGVDVCDNEMTSEEVMVTKAVDFLNETDEQEVDFLYLVQSFFSFRCTAAAGHLLECVRDAPEIIINFLKYINMHDVLPEYRSQINEAIEFAEKAKVEIYTNKLLSLQLPGGFNRSLCTIFGSHFGSIDTSAQEWNAEKVADIARLPSESSALQYISQMFPDLLKSQKRNPTRLSGLPVEVRSIGKHHAALSRVILVPWYDIPGTDRTEDPQTKVSEMLILVENSIADIMYERLHLEADFYELTVNVGGHDNLLYYMDSVTRVLPTFYVEIDDEDG